MLPRRIDERAGCAVKRISGVRAGDGGHANRLLARLPSGALSRLTPHLESVHLDRKDVLFRAHEPLRAVYFPGSAVVSMVARLETGETLEVGLIGRDGLAGTAILAGVTTMSCDGIVQVPGLAYRMRPDVLRLEMLADDALSSAVGRYSQLLLVRSMQMSACNAFHSVEQRCLRWLLTVADLIGGGDIPVTHELLAAMLGVRRPTVTLAIQSLDRARLVEEQRGRIVCRDRTRLEAACCECYRAMREEQRRLLGYS